MSLPSAPAALAATYHGIEIPEAPIFSKGMLTSLREGRYEHREIQCGMQSIPKGSRLLELGAGSGVVGAVLTRNLDLAATLSIEANPGLLPHAENLHRHNGLQDRITLRHAVVLTAPDAPDSITFYIHGHFLGSSLVKSEDKKMTPTEVPVLRYDALKAEFPHDAIMMDIEGGELEFLRHADLSGVNVFVAEMHRDAYGREGIHECRRLLESAGLKHDQDISKGGVQVFRR